MNILIDTHIFIWLLKKPSRIADNHVSILRAPNNSFFLSSVSVTELMIKSGIGKLTVDFDPVEMAEKSGLKLLDFSAEDAMKMADLPLHHKDPFDRMLLAQCLNRDMVIMTSDQKFKLYNCVLA